MKKAFGIISLLLTLYILYIAVSAGDYVTWILTIPLIYIGFDTLNKSKHKKILDIATGVISALILLFVLFVAVSAGIVIVWVLIIPALYIFLSLFYKNKK